MSCTTPLSDADRAALQARLTKLQAAYDSILAGTRVVEFRDQNGETVRYGTADQGKLLSEINAIRARLDSCFSRYYRPRPLGFVFPRQ